MKRLGKAAIFFLFMGAAGETRADEPAPVDVTATDDKRIVPVSKQDPSAGSTVVPKKRLQEAGATAADVLSGVPSVQVSRTGASSDFATASIRGATSAQTPVYLAGIRLNDDVTGTADLSAVPVWMLDRAEVFRGNAPGRADQLGIGGAIFFEPTLPRKTQVGAGANIGSYGEWGVWANAALVNARGGALFAVRRDSAENDYAYVDEGGTPGAPEDDVVRKRENGHFEAYDVWALGRVSLGANGRVLFVTNGYFREQGAFGRVSEPALRASQSTKRLLSAADASLSCGARCRLGLVTTMTHTNTEFRDPLFELSLGTPLLSTKGTRVAQDVVWRNGVGDRLNVSVNARQSLERLRVDRLGSEGIHALRATSRLALTARWDVTDWLGAHAIGAAELHQTSRSGGFEASEAEGPHEDSVFVPAGRVGLWVQPHKNIEIVANLGRYSRVPTLAERFGYTSFVRGNPDLAPEIGTTADLGIRLWKSQFLCKTCRGFLEVMGYAAWAENLVAYRQSTFGVFRPYNVGESRTLGIEASAGAAALDHVRADVSLTFTDPEDTTPGLTVTDNTLPFRSRTIVAPSVEVFAERPFASLPLDRVSLGNRFIYRSARSTGTGGAQKIAPQATWDIQAEVSFWDRRLSVRGAIRNVLDAPQADAIGLALPGRTVHAQVESFW